MTKKIVRSICYFTDFPTNEKSLHKLGYKTTVPITARRMRKTGDFDAEKFKSWFRNANDYKIKKRLMDDHFKKILKSDAVLVVNREKKGVKGYIGGNVLMEMCVAYINKIPIYLWNSIDNNSPFEEEIKAMNCISIDQDPTKIKLSG